MRARLVILAALALTGCRDDETLTAYGAGDMVWHLAEIDGAPFEDRAIITFDASGAVNGEGPCNTFTATQTAPYPWFRVEDLAVTRRACPALSAEAVFLTALQKMTLVEAVSDIMILRNDANREMVFRARPSE